MSDINAQVSPPDKTDLHELNWIMRVTPAGLRPYAYLMRLDRPIGTWLLLLPAWWSIALAAGATQTLWQPLEMAALFAIGALIMRGAGCVINDLWDRDFDAMVARTRTRPLAAGTITPQEAVAFLFVLLLAGLMIVLQMNLSTVLLGFLSLPFIALYPFMKRITWWPQFFLGLTFNFGALMGWCAITSTLASGPLLLYVAGIFWTLGYDTIYAHMDKDDDARIGVKSTARLFGTRTKPIIALFYGLATVFLLMAAASIGMSFVLVPGAGIIAALFAWQVNRLDINDPALCLRLFRFNRDQGLAILGVFALHALALALAA